MLAFVIDSFAQGVYTGGYVDRTYVEKELNKFVKSEVKHGSATELRTSVQGDTVIYDIIDPDDPFKIKLTFHIDDSAYCNYQEFLFNCSPCSEKHLQDFMRTSKFRKKPNGTYLSSWLYCSEMTVVYSNSGCLKLVFRTVMLPRKEYMALYKSLPH